MATARPDRRVVRYESLDDALQDAERLARGGYRTTGLWTYGQILEHLARSGDACFDGFDEIGVPWWARTFIAPLVRRRFLHKAMPAGVKLPATAVKLLPPVESTVEEGLSHLRQAAARFVQEMPTAPHPFLGRLRNKKEYMALMCRHCELHLSFVHPQG